LGLGILLLVISVSDGAPGTAFIGMALTLYAWFTKHTRYVVFHDRLVIEYGKPRERSVPLDGIMRVQGIAIPMRGTNVLLVRDTGRGMLVRPENPDEFMARFTDALSGHGRPAKEEPRTPL
jgi:hypothetical protein